MPKTSPPQPDDNANATLLVALTDLLGKAKVLSAPIQWVEEGRDLRFTTTLEIDEVTDDRLLLRGRASAGMPDRQVSLLLVWIAGPAQHALRAPGVAAARPHTNARACQSHIVTA